MSTRRASLWLTVLLHPVRSFDQLGTDATFGHTFEGIPAPICSGTIEIRLRAAGSASSNDTFHLEFREKFILGSLAWSYSVPIAQLTGTSWQSGEEVTFLFDLDDLPPDTIGRTTVLADFLDGEIDVAVDDDTAVDYIVLRLRNDCVVAMESSTWGRLKSWYVPPR